MDHTEHSESFSAQSKLSKKITSIKPSGIRKFFDVANEIPDVVSLGVGEPDFDTPWHIRDAGIQSLQQGKTFYTSNAGLIELRNAICQYTKRKIGVDYSPKDEVVVTVGGSEAIDAAFRALLDPGDEVIIVEPCFVSYAPCVTLADGIPVIVEVKEENSFRLKPNELEAKITNKTKIVMFSYPNNPTGAIMEKTDLEPIADVIKKHDLIVISDEIYSELTYGTDHFSIAELPGMKERTIVINGFSKAFAMTGWRLGYALGNKEIIRQMTKVHQFGIMSAPTTSQYAAIEAMNNSDEDVIMMRNSYDQRRRFLLNFFKKYDIPCFEPHGAFYVFPNISRYGMTSEEFATRLLKEEKLAVVPGDAFGECGEGFIRISYAYSIDELKKATRRLASFIENLNKT